MGARPGLARTVIRGVFLAGFCICCLGLAFGLAGAAAEPGPEFEVPVELATEPALPSFETCPEALPPEPFESEDAAAVQIYELRRESNIGCRVEAERLDHVIARQWWIVSQLLGEQAKAKQIEERLEVAEVNDLDRNEVLREINNNFIPGPLAVKLDGVDVENPLPVSGAGGASTESTAELVAAVDAAGESTSAAAYVIAGLLAALFIGYCLWRTVRDGT